MSRSPLFPARSASSHLPCLPPSLPPSLLTQLCRDHHTRTHTLLPWALCVLLYQPGNPPAPRPRPACTHTAEPSWGSAQPLMLFKFLTVSLRGLGLCWLPLHPSLCPAPPSSHSPAGPTPSFKKVKPSEEDAHGSPAPQAPAHLHLCPQLCPPNPCSQQARERRKSRASKADLPAARARPPPFLSSSVTSSLLARSFQQHKSMLLFPVS